MNLRKSLLHPRVLEFLLQLCVRSLENLLMRFEEPSSMVRWDAPLFSIPWTDEAIPGEQIWESITKGNLKPPNSGTLSVGQLAINTP
jgi:protein KTI12